MDLHMLKEEIEAKGTFSFSRSSGPGGQNVNKVNSKVLLTLNIDSLTCINDEQRSRIRERLKNRMNSSGELYLQIQEERSQLQNRERAVRRMADLIETAMKRQVKRRATRPSKAAHKRRLDKKKIQSRKKSSRGRVSQDS